MILYVLNNVDIVDLVPKSFGEWIIVKLFNFTCPYVHGWLFRWLWENSVEREAWAHRGSSAELEKNWSRAIQVRLTRVTLVIETYLFCLALARSFYHRRLYAVPLSLLFLPSPSPIQQTRAHSQHRLRYKGLPESQSKMASAITFSHTLSVFFYGNCYTLVIWVYLSLLQDSGCFDVSAIV